MDRITHKEMDPEKTIGICRGILKSLGLELEEIERYTGTQAFSMHLKIYYNGVFLKRTNGKGITRELALAAAYAEMLERIQGSPHHLYHDLGEMYLKEYLCNDGFVAYPTEIQERDIEKYKKEDLIFKYIKEYTKGSKHADRIVDNYITNVFETFGYLPLQEYTNAVTGEKVKINDFLFRTIVQRTTGLCAGNSKYEALVQGLSEIAERYSRYVIFRDNLVLPLIPDDIIAKSKHTYEMYKDINSSRRFKMEIRDASLGLGLPVVCVILYDRYRRGYRVSMGAFPAITVAMDRTMNELVQGSHIDNLDLIEFSAYGNSHIGKDVKVKTLDGEKDFDELRDSFWILRNITNSTGMYKDKFFTNDYSYEFDPSIWDMAITRDNEQMFKDLSKLISEKFDTEVLYKDYSYLGFPTYSIICPKIMTESSLGNGDLYWIADINRRIFEEQVFKSDKLDESKLVKLRIEGHSNGLSVLTGRPSKYDLSTEFAKAYLEFIKGNYRESSRLFSFSNPNPPEGVPEEILFKHLDIWGCFINYIALMDSVKDKLKIREILEKIYKKEIVELIEGVLKDNQSLTNALFKDRQSELNVINWELFDASVEIVNKLNKRKLKWIEKMKR